MKHVLVATGIVALLCAVTAAAASVRADPSARAVVAAPDLGPGGPGRRLELDHAGQGPRGRVVGEDR